MGSRIYIACIFMLLLMIKDDKYIEKVAKENEYLGLISGYFLHFFQRQILGFY